VRGLEIGVADGVVDDVGALPRRQLTHARGDIGGGGIDHLDRRTRIALIRFALADDADRARAVPCCDLHRGLAYLAVDAHHQHGFACFRHAGAAQAFHRGDKGHADAGRLFPGNRARLVDDRLRLDHEVRGMGAVATNAEIAGRAEHVAAHPVGGAIDDNPGVVAARRAREHGVRHQAGGGLDIRRIDRRRLDLDQQLVQRARQRAPLDDGRDPSHILGLCRQANAARFGRNRRAIGLLRSGLHGRP
jgi:hypothetical protein